MSTQQFFFDDGATARTVPKVDRAEYLNRCRRRWHGAAMKDARWNFSDFQKLVPVLEPALRDFKRNPVMKDVMERFHNPDGTLGAMLWKLQEAIEPDRSCLEPLLDFEDRHQKIFLRRGLIIFCELMLKQLP